MSYHNNATSFEQFAFVAQVRRNLLDEVEIVHEIGPFAKNKIKIYYLNSYESEELLS